MLTIRRLILLLGLAPLAAACGAADAVRGDTTLGTRAFPDHPLITPSQAALRVADTVRLSVRYPADFFPPIYPPARWSSANAAIASVDSLSGLVTARDTGTITIVATLLADPNLKGAMILRVTP
jgi:hypothetical protein